MITAKEAQERAKEERNKLREKAIKISDSDIQPLIEEAISNGYGYITIDKSKYEYVVVCELKDYLKSLGYRVFQECYSSTIDIIW